MTIFAAVILPETAHVCTDTACFQADGEFYSFTSKLFPLPHIDAVIGGRGAREPLADAYCELLAEPLPNGVDDLAERGQEIFRRRFARYMTRTGRTARIISMAEFATTTPDEMMEAFVIGYSYSLKVYRGLAFHNIESDFAPMFFDPNSDMMSPPANVVGFQWTTSQPGVHDVVRASKAQYKAAAENGLGNYVGGEVQAATLRPGSIEVRTIDRYPNYNNLVTAIGGTVRPLASKSPEARQNTPQAPQGLSRAERRRLEREQRKGRRHA
ncbi:hypothetical protein [Ferruginivarius sediminum]|uniref:Uncharacterized protein n=1 Tax=Ferruginivarius sediminum TaxID=2661937 RepID=A0A369TAC9_9PROT|nr:hypothetical protein [Ferruginivarius sediminum]RDD61454.1 hypothetical protein DRB17_13345 [Ferruginivarius sediminum]